ncbi:MAG: hypothetical protein AMJ65_06260, partial [Phycisphaerae bacterium SG8_4]
MKLTTYSKDGSVSAARRPVGCGILTDAGLIDILSAWDGADPPRSVKEILERGPVCLAQLAELEKSAPDPVPLDSVKLLAPIPRPGKILALAGNYVEHIKEGGGKLGLSDSPR